IDFKHIFGKLGVRWLHTGGIFTALSDGTASVCKEALTAAKEAGTIVSYDLNFRSKLWSAAEAQKKTRDLVPLMDCLTGNEEDFPAVTGFKVEGIDEHNHDAPDTSAYQKKVEKVVKTYPNIKVVGTTFREEKSGLINNWAATLYVDGTFCESRQHKDLEIED